MINQSIKVEQNLMFQRSDRSAAAVGKVAKARAEKRRRRRDVVVDGALIRWEIEILGWAGTWPLGRLPPGHRLGRFVKRSCRCSLTLLHTQYWVEEPVDTWGGFSVSTVRGHLGSTHFLWDHKGLKYASDGSFEKA